MGAVPDALISPRTKHKTTESFRCREAMTLDGNGLRRTMARDGEQAIEGALHSDRRIQQYGLQMGRVIGAGTKALDGTTRGSRY